MSAGERCGNFNHGKAVVSIRFCPECGEKINGAVTNRCDETKHAVRRKDRHAFCFDCGKKLR